MSSYHDIKLRKTDTLFSKYIRNKAKWRCEMCNRVCKTSNGEIVAKLEAAHYFGRRKESVRFDPENVYALCFNCHKRVGDYKNSEDGEYDLWVKEKLGDKGYKLLKLRAYTYKKRDDAMDLIIINELLKNG